jgi:EAL domain-containing protein (putative c-di-GMP-specific phosphodiesterase class I)
LVGDMRQNAAIVRSMIELGYNLSMGVVAEGIESADVLAQLDEYGCDLAQGYCWPARWPWRSWSSG